MTSDSVTSLESIIAPWPIANNISRHLPVGDLISLARTNTILRASLHGFANYPPNSEYEGQANGLGSKEVRSILNIGFHDTVYWQRLKDLAPFECVSKTHTKGTKPRPCHYCSRPICEACIVRASMLRVKEDTFKNRCRYLCPTCWDGGNVSKTRRFPLASSRQHQAWYGREGGTKDEICFCKAKDSWLCLECKDRQNVEATTDAVKQCHGEGCGNSAGEDRERRRICTWCHKTLPRHLGGPARYEWTQKMIEARQRSALSRQADLEEYNKKRLKLMRMSRREMRGDGAVKDDPEADLPQFIRHLDTFNYRRFMPECAIPSGNAVYLSKKGYWMYSKEFLRHTGNFCEKLPSRPELSSATRPGSLAFARSNMERTNERAQYRDIQKDLAKKTGMSINYSRLDEWHNLKATILDIFIAQAAPFEQAQFSVFRDYNFWADQAEYEYMFSRWGHSWRKVRLTDADPPEEEPEPESCEDSDLQFAIKLQEQMDRETAEEWQYAYFDDAEIAKLPSPIRGFAASQPQTTEQAESAADRDQDRAANLSTSSGSRPEPASPSQPGDTSSGKHRRASPSQASDPESSMAARQQCSRPVTWPLPQDDPPPYETGHRWPIRSDPESNDDEDGKGRKPFMTFEFETNNNDSVDVAEQYESNSLEGDERVDDHDGDTGRQKEPS